MAKETYNIDYNGVEVQVPAWATREQLENLIKLDAGSLRALQALLRDNKTYTNKTLQQNEKLLSSLDASVVDVGKRQERRENNNQKKTEALFKKQIDEIKKSKARDKSSADNITKGLKKHVDSLGDATKDLATGVKKMDLQAIATAIGGVVGLGTVAGAAVGILEGFSKALISLSNTGVGLGSDLMQLRGQAAQAGLDLEGYSRVINANAAAIRSLGSTTNEGAANFSRLSESLRDQAREFNNFGLSNTEYNEILAEEIEIRRRAGMDSATITSQVSESMNRLLTETTAMANMTGQDRRELVRRRQEQLREASTNLRLIALQREGVDTAPIIDKIGAITDTLGKGSEELASAFVSAAMNDLDFAQINGGEFQRMANLAGEDVSTNLRDIFNTFRASLMDPTVSSEELRIQMQSMVANLSQAGSAADFRRVATLSGVGSGDTQAAAQSISQLFQNLGNMTTTADEARTQFNDTVQGLRDTPLLALPAELETLANNIKASTLDTVINSLGVDVQNAGTTLVDAIREMSNNFGPGKGLIEGMGETFGELPTSIKLLTAAIITLTGVMAAQSAISFGRGLGRLGRGVRARVGRTMGPSARTGVRNFFGRINPFSATNRGAGTAAARTGAAVAADAGTTAARTGATVASTAVTEGAEAASTTAARTAAREAGETAARAAGKSFLKKIPLIGLLAGGAFAIDRAMRGDWTGAGMELASGAASTIPIAGTAASVGIDAALLARDLGVFDGDEIDMEQLEQQAASAQADLNNAEIRGRMTEEEIARQQQIVDLYNQQLEIKQEEERVAQAERTARIAELQESIALEQARIERSREGQNEYWGRESVGRAESSRAIAEMQNELNNLQPPATTPEQPTQRNNPAIPAQAILDIQRSQENAFNEASSALSSFENEAGEKVQIGTHFDPLEGTTVATMGYADPEKQAEYNRLRREKAVRARDLNKTENDNRYKLARTTELGQKMGIDPGSDGIYNNSTLVGGVATQIEGQAVDRSLLTQRELTKITAAEKMSAAMNKTTTPGTNNTGMTSDQADSVVRELKETNRLLKKQTNTIEMNN